MPHLPHSTAHARNLTRFFNNNAQNKIFHISTFFELWHKISCFAAQCKHWHSGFRSRSSCGHPTLPWKSEHRHSPGMGLWKRWALDRVWHLLCNTSALGMVFSLSFGHYWAALSSSISFFLIILFIGKLIKSLGEDRMWGSFLHLSVQM